MRPWDYNMNSHYSSMVRHKEFIFEEIKKVLVRTSKKQVTFSFSHDSVISCYEILNNKD